MREAIGSSWLIYLLLTFILIYVFFIAFIMNYAAAYRAANYVVTQIENNQGQLSDYACDANGRGTSSVCSYISKKYHYIGPVDTCYIRNGNGSYVFRVRLKVKFEAPLFGQIGVMNVRAETKTIPNSQNLIIATRECSKDM